MGINIFISYVTTDADFFKISEIAEKIGNYPEIDKVLYWQRDAPGSIPDYMNKNIPISDIFLLFCSQRIIDSEAVKAEWETALYFKKDIIPIFIDITHVPPILRRLHGIPFNINDFDKIIDMTYELILKKIKYSNMMENIRVYDKSMNYIGIRKRKEIHEIHENPLWHKTCIILVMHPNGKMLYIIRSKNSRINPNLFDCFGGHLEDDETYLESAKRELSEELGIAKNVIKDKDLIQIGDEGQFKVAIEYPPKYQNYEFSTCYLYFSKEEFILNAKELFGTRNELLELRGDYFEDLLVKFNKDSSKFADGIDRILKDKNAVQEIEELIKIH